METELVFLWRWRKQDRCYGYCMPDGKDIILSTCIEQKHKPRHFKSRKP